MRRVAVWTLLCAVTLFSTAAFADRVHLKDGRVIQGQVIDKGDQVEIRLKLGSTTVRKDEIVRIEKVKSPAEVYKEKSAALADDDADGHFQLAQWCREQDLTEEAHAQLLKVIAIDPEHARARALLGHVKVGGAWLDTTTTTVVTVDNQMPVAAEVRLDGKTVVSVEATGSGVASVTPGEHRLQVVLSDDRRLDTSVALEPGKQYALALPVPQPEHVLRYSDQGFYVFPSEVTEFVYQDGRCRYARLADGARLGTLEGSVAPGPASFSARDLGEALGLDGTFSKVYALLQRRGRRARPDPAGGARLLVTPGLFAILSTEDLENIKEDKFKPRDIRLVADAETRYGAIDRIEAGSDFTLDRNGNVNITLGGLSVKLTRSSVTVQPADRRSRGDYVIMPDSVILLSRGGRRSVVSLQEGVVKPLAEPPKQVRPSRRGGPPRLPRDAILWSPTGYTVTRQPDEDHTQSTFYSERLMVVLEAKPLATSQ